MAKLILSPSQQEANQYAGGATGVEDSEERWMQKLAVKVKTLWDKQATGIPCVIVNKGSWSANAAESNRLGATEHVALHTNAGGGHGTEIFHYTGSVGGKKLATNLYPFIATASNMPDRGVKASSTLGELRATKAKAVIVEYLFHDNAAEAQEMRTSLDEFAVATVKGLCIYYGKPYKVPVPPTVPTTPPAPTTPTTPTPAPKVWTITAQDLDTIHIELK